MIMVSMVNKRQTGFFLHGYLFRQEFLIHEQYFYPDYTRYIPEYAQIVLTAAKWAAEHGYRGALMSEVMFEKFRSNDLPQS